MGNRKIYWTLSLLIVTLSLGAQETSPIQIFSPQQTNLGNQNWMISQGEDRTLYFGNNKGLALYNGAHWELYPTSDFSIMRSVKAIGNRVYSGNYMDLGYWEKNSSGRLNYTSLKETLDIEVLEDEQFWNILSIDNTIVFQSLNRLILYDKKSEKVQLISPDGAILKSFMLEGKIYFQVQGKGLYGLENGKKVLYSSHPIITKENIVQLFIKDQSLFFLTEKSGFYKLIEDTENEIQSWGPATRHFENFTLYSAIELSNGGFALGTVGSGLLFLNDQGEIVDHIQLENGLSNNTVLSLFEDDKQNLWLGLDNGINLINTASAFKEYIDVTGQLGSIYTSAVHQGYLYVGTNQGLFVKRQDRKEKFSLIEDTQGQVWSLATIGRDLFCGHNTGAFLIEGKKAKRISDIKGTWLFRQHPTEAQYIFLGNFTGLYIIEKKDQQWIFRNKVDGFDISSRYLEFTSSKRLLVNHEYKGVFKIQLSEDYKKAIKVEIDPSSCISCNSSLATFNNEVYYHTKEGLMKYHADKDAFKNNNLLSSIQEKEKKKIDRIVNDNQNRLWVFSENNLHNLYQDKATNQGNISGFSLKEIDRKNVSGFEHINRVSENTYLIGTSKGYLTVNLNKLVKDTSSLAITAIEVNNKKNLINLSLYQNSSLVNDYNNLQFKFTSFDYKRFTKTSYQYKLKGEDENWSKWSENPTANYANLPYGTYQFLVRSKYEGQVSNPISSPEIYIAPPWYLDTLALSTYLFVILIMLYIYNNYTQKQIQRQKDKLKEESKQINAMRELETKQQMTRLKNEQLQKDVESKNRELAVSTMSTLKRNEFLNTLKQKLQKVNDLNQVKELIKIINEKLNSNDDWEYFKKAFDNSDQAFFQKIKQAHPSLTNNDLKLCAYLRLNLSSKEIAPLLNISVHSVEIKRYRLRKKMALTRKQGIVEYILSF